MGRGGGGGGGGGTWAIAIDYKKFGVQPPAHYKVGKNYSSLLPLVNPAWSQLHIKEFCRTQHMHTHTHTHTHTVHEKTLKY